MPKNKDKPENKPISSPINKEIFKELMGETFRSINITLISIVQGVSLGILIFKTASIFLIESGGQEYYLNFMYAIFSFTGIIIITFEYAHYVGVFKRTVNILDIFIPYLLGISQSLPMFFFNNAEMWWFFEAALMGSASLAWNNTRRNCIVEVFGECESARERYHRNMRNKSLSALAMLVMCVLAGYLIAATQGDIWLQFAFGSILFCWAFWVLITSHKLVSKLHEDFGSLPTKWF